jgi:hypothetical protein
VVRSNVNVEVNVRIGLELVARDEIVNVVTDADTVGNGGLLEL